VGDTRVYRLRDDRLEQLTRDITVFSYEGDVASNERALADLLRRALGLSPMTDPEITSLALRRGDRLLLCTDGLFCMLARPDMEQILRAHADPEAACDALIDAGTAVGGPDDLTAIVVDHGPVR
jgi:PPM family protein phosphatase